MFREYGYKPRVVHGEVIPQHRETSLITLARMESCGQSDFEFFEDRAAQRPINARVAEQRRVAGELVYHKIYVIEGALMR